MCLSPFYLRSYASPGGSRGSRNPFKGVKSPNRPSGRERPRHAAKYRIILGKEGEREPPGSYRISRVFTYKSNFGTICNIVLRQLPGLRFATHPFQSPSPLPLPPRPLRDGSRIDSRINTHTYTRAHVRLPGEEPSSRNSRVSSRSIISAIET